MKIQIKFGNDVGTYNFEDNSIQGVVPLELRVEKLDADNYEYNSNLSLALYVSAFASLFKGVTNFTTGDIQGIQIQRSGFDTVTKDKDGVRFENQTKGKTVIYEISKTSMNEQMYYSEDLDVKNIASYTSESLEGLVKENVTSKVLWQTGLIEPSQEVLRNNIVDAITATTFIPGVDFFWEDNGTDKGKLSLISDDGNIEMDDIEADEVYYLIKLIEQIAHKGVHKGVIFINAQGISDTVLNALLFAMQTFFSETHVFLTYLDDNSKVVRSRVELPDFKTRKLDIGRWGIL